MHYSEGARDMTSVVVTALCNQPESFASDLGDDHSHYLLCYLDATLFFKVIFM